MRVGRPVAPRVVLELVGAAALAGAWAACRAPARATGELPPGDHERTVRVGAETRRYLLHVPPRGGGPPARPVVIAFHGGGGNPGEFRASAGLDPVADREGFLVAYPAGTGPARDRLLTWNAGGACCGPARERDVDDVAFVRVLLDDLVQVASVDRARIYATGHSNGAMMAYRVAAEASRLVAAVAPVAGAMQFPALAPDLPTPVLHIHSVDDPRAPYGGGLGPPFPVGGARTMHEPVEAGLAAWREVNGCADSARIVERRPAGGGVTPMGHSAQHLVWEGCRSGAPVELWRLRGPGHAWPGAAVAGARERLVGPPTDVLDASEAVWQFLSRFRREGG
jgi:polyhydroxybutyrate depolymerase